MTNSRTSNTLLACPFCGRGDLLGFEPTTEGGFIAVKCRACGTHGPAKLSTDEREAAAHWNHRPTHEPRARDADLIEWVSGLVEALDLAGITRAKGDEHIDQDYLAELTARLARTAQPPGESRLRDDEALIAVVAGRLAICDGHDDPHHLCWSGNPPEPEGEVWTRYVGSAQMMLELIDKCLTAKRSETTKCEGQP